MRRFVVDYKISLTVLSDVDHDGGASPALQDGVKPCFSSCATFKLRYIFAMLILKGHRFRLDLLEHQAALCSRTAGSCRWLWNLALEQRSMAWSQGRHSVGFAAQCAELPSLKAAVPWLQEAPSHCLQQTLRDLDQAFQRFFAGQAGYPVFHRKFQRASFRFPDPKPF